VTRTSIVGLNLCWWKGVEEESVKEEVEEVVEVEIGWEGNGVEIVGVIVVVEVVGVEMVEEGVIKIFYICIKTFNLQF